MCCAFTEVQQFGESEFYIEASKSLLCDEYTGALYPVLLMLTRGMEDLLPIPYTYIMYLVQLGVAVFAGCRFLGTLGCSNCPSVLLGKAADRNGGANARDADEYRATKEEGIGVRRNAGKKMLYKVWGSLALLTFPMTMQCHMAILPNSLASSCFLLEMAYIMKTIRGKEAFQAADVAKACTGWLLAALLLPEYLYLGAVPLILFFLYDVVHGCFRREQKRIRSVCYHGILIAAFAGMIVGANSLTQVEGCCGRPQKSVSAALFRRVAWSSLQDYYDIWPEDMKDCFTMEEVSSIAAYADNMERLLQPRLEAELGVDRANEIYQELGRVIWQNNTAGILHQTAWDAVGYTLPPVTVQLFLTGRGYDSYLGRNYDIMRQEAPRLTDYYMDYSCWWFTVGLGILAVMALGDLADFIGKKKKSQSMVVALFPMVICAASAGCMVIRYTLQGAGMWDYKNALFVGQLWLSGMLVLAERNVYGAYFTKKSK